ncbi:MAG: ATP phosphoribosyltransferase, partial [Sphingomonadales bacterium]|nr:ATP phosphoribosyltransferase [Sphingomonadales bacterium]
VDIMLVRDDDIPGFVSEGICDFGIVGENVYEEAISKSVDGLNAEVLLPLGFSTCRLSIAVPEEVDYEGAGFLDGKTIATSYPGILKRYLDQQGVSSHVVEMRGSVEVAPRLHIADAICDIVSTGGTLRSNGLLEKDIVLESQAIMIRNPKPLSDDKEALVQKILQRMKGVLASANTKYIMMNADVDAVEAISALLPGAEAPTVVPLAGDNGRVALHAVCPENIFWETMEGLKAAGASAILVLPIEKMLS